jgi:hypothetical protein
MEEHPFFSDLCRLLRERESELEGSVLDEETLWRILRPSVRRFYVLRFLQAFLGVPTHFQTVFKRLKPENQEILKDLLSGFPTLESPPEGLETSLVSLLGDKMFASAFKEEFTYFLDGYFKKIAHLLNLNESSRRLPHLVSSVLRSKMIELAACAEEAAQLNGQIGETLEKIEEVLFAALDGAAGLDVA